MSSGGAERKRSDRGICFALLTKDPCGAEPGRPLTTLTRPETTDIKATTTLLEKGVAALLLFQALSVLVPAVSSFKQLMRVELGVVGGPSESKANPSLRPG